MRRAFLWKFLSTLFVAALLLVPLGMIKGKIDERRYRRDSVAEELAATGVGSQRIAGPILVIPCIERYTEEVTDSKGIKQLEKRTRDCTQTFSPTALRLSGALDTEQRVRGIYEVLFYSGVFDISGEFEVSLLQTTTAEGGTRAFGDPELRLGVRDVRGIREAVKLQWNNHAYAFAPGSNESALGAGIHARLAGVGAEISGRHAFALTLNLRGSRSLAFVPMGKQTQIELSGQWPHPSFYGRFLPDSRSITNKDFSATWKISELAANDAQAVLRCDGGNCGELAREEFGVALIDPVDIYMQSGRAVNYGFLFVGLTFVIFMLFEIMKSLRVHPVQYGLVGLGLAVFFLLLFSLAEHVNFMRAYLIAAAACVALITFYVGHILHSVKTGLLFSIYLTGLYTALYMLLRSEDYAMLLGAILVFAMLAIVMVLTRRIDWYRVGERLGAVRTEQSVA